MSANVKIGNDTIQNVSSVKLQSADTAGTYVEFPLPSGNQDIANLNEYNVASKATARISATERAKIIPENIKKDVTLLGVTGTHEGGGSGGYSITCFVSNGTYSGSTATFGAPNTAQVTITPNSNYALPTSVAVVGATKNYNSTTGIITLTNATGDIAITAVCDAVYSVAKTITNGSASGDSTIISGRTASVTIIPNTGYDTPASVTVTGASYTYDRESGIVSLSNPTSNVTIVGECAPASIYKGKIISIDMDGDGTDEQYRVIKLIENDVVEVLAMDDAGNVAFDSSNTSNTYENCTLDNYLNSTWYNTLSSTAKSAIVAKTFTQDKWINDSSGSPSYAVKYSSVDGRVSKQTNEFGNITRNIYAISLQDIIDYVEATPEMTAADTTLTNNNIKAMWYSGEAPATEQYLWMNSASGANAKAAYCVMQNGNPTGNIVNYSLSIARPAFRIDLSKISWS